MSNSKKSNLKRTLGPLMLWGLGVGYVISGMYFGWNLGLEKGGTLGLATATFFIIILYLCFTFSYTELSCAMPKAGGVFIYAKKALGKHFAFLGGMAQNIEFIFAPPAIAIAIGAYLNLLLKNKGIDVDSTYLAISAYIIFTFINIIGVKTAAVFEFIVTVIAVIELLIFFFAATPSFEWSNVTTNPLPNGWLGAFAAIPFAIWFFLAIEGVANLSEETINPQKNILKGFGSAIITLVILCIITFLSSVGVNGWETVVYDNGNSSDSPLPLVLSHIYGKDHILYSLVTSIGLFGLVASFHGILLAGGRSTFEFGREKFAPKFLGRVHSKFRTPANALVVNAILGLIAIATGKTSEIITMAVMGALTLYIVAMVSVLVLRKKEPNLERPFKVPLYPVTPIVALIIAVIAFIAVIIYYYKIALIYFGLLLLCYILWIIINKNNKTAV